MAFLLGRLIEGEGGEGRRGERKDERTGQGRAGQGWYACRLHVIFFSRNNLPPWISLGLVFCVCQLGDPSFPSSAVVAAAVVVIVVVML